METTKKERVVTSAFNMDEGTITMAVKGVGDVVLALNKVHSDMVNLAAYKGFVARLTDAAALGKDATAQQKFDAIAEVRDYYEGGATEWERKGSGGGFGVKRIDVLEAMMYVFGLDGSTAEAKVAALAKRDHGGDEKAALKQWAESDKIAKRLAEVKASRATKSADDLLEGL